MDLDGKFRLLPEAPRSNAPAISIASAWAQPTEQDLQPIHATSIRFRVIKRLGAGSQGFVLLMSDAERNGQLVAVKYCHQELQNMSRIKYMAREVLNHRELSLFQHPHIVQLYEVFPTPRYLAMVLEYVDGLDLFTYLNSLGGRLSEDDARAIFQQLILAVDFCHRIGKGHRDIKLGNILVQGGNSVPLIKLCDFGFSKDKDDSVPKSQVGTAFFFAPEVAISSDTEPYEAAPADLWACGVVLYMLLWGGHPFLQKNDQQFPFFILKLINNSKEGKIHIPPGAEETMPGAVALVKSLLVYEPAARIKVPELMQDPWFLTRLPTSALSLNDRVVSTNATSRPPEGWFVMSGWAMESGNSALLDELNHQLQLRQKARFQASSREASRNLST